MTSFMNLFCVLLNYWIESLISPGWVVHMNLMYFICNERNIQLVTYLCPNAPQFYFFYNFENSNIAELPTDCICCRNAQNAGGNASPVFR